MTSAQIIVLATPLFLALMALEWAVGQARARNTYHLHDMLSSTGLGVFSQVLGLLTKLFALGLYVAVYETWAFKQLPANAAWVWLTALLLYDFLYYWHHRLGHRVALLWAAHVVHHQSEDYNLSTALRQTSTGWIFGWVFYMPMALLGFPPLVFGVVALVDLLYQFWVHTQLIGRLGWFDRWFCAPSNHRVHHAVNDAYVDRNYGGILIIWDRLFGSFAPERDDEPCIYGTRSPLRSFNPLWANFEVYASLWRDSWHTRAWADKLRLWLKPPGWRPLDVAQRFPKAAFDILQVQRFEPRTAHWAKACSAALLLLLLGAATAVLWFAHLLPLWLQALAAALILAGLCLMGRLGAGLASDRSR